MMTDPPPRPARPSLRRYWLLSGALVLVLLLAFAVVEALGVPVLTDPGERLGRGGAAAALLGVGLLVADVFLPVPSSVVMVAHGALFGVVAGAALSLAGSVGAAALGFALGRRGSRAIERVVTAAEKARADELLDRWGALAVVVTRPVPLLAEATAILAGASRMGWGRLLGASVAGALPPSLLYALAGATSRVPASAALVFALVLGLAAVVWRVGARGR